ncbi:MAG: DUF364 domain-containing protein [Bacteroidales bacterium]|nr:DUF364 domain-containing protein [Bacteroidales bacterium]MBN2758742.1 DUF364 domain-containing protein [Bacteroidales bacterium]
MILQETINLLKNKYKDYIETLSISDVRIGLFMTAIQLSDGTVGVSSVAMPEESDVHCKKSNRDFGDFSPLNITGKSVLELIEFPNKNSIIQSLKIAVLNAISSKLLENSDYKILENSDPIDLIDLHSRKTITMVGAFQSYIDRISKTDNKLFVLEFNENALIGDDKKFFVPAKDYKTVLPISDIVIITGLTLVNNTFENLLKSIKPKTQIIVTGPSSSFIPDVLFSNNVNIIGAVKATNPELMLKVVSQAGAGYHLYKYCAEKICIVYE